MPYIYQDEAEHLGDDAWINGVASLSNRDGSDGSDVVDMSAQIRQAIKSHGGPGAGKWVRYDSYGRMIKGWYCVYTDEDIQRYPDQAGNWYYYDLQTGLMAKGWVTINGNLFYFDEVTGVWQQ